MRIAIDLQACQAANRRQGIGRYSLELTRALLRHAAPRHEILLALNADLPMEADRVRSMLSDVAGPDQFVAWRADLPLGARGASAPIDYRNAQRLRNQFFASLGVDLVHTCSVFEGFADPAVTAIAGPDARTHVESVTLYDLIPLLHPDLYLADPELHAWYSGKVAQLRHADLLLAISDSSRNEALQHLGVPQQCVVNVSSGADGLFRPASLSPAEARGLRERFGIRNGFVMYGGGVDVRKNLERLVEAYARLPMALREAYQLAIVCRITDADRTRLLALGRQHGVDGDRLVFTGYVDDADLVALYSVCDAFVFPSWHEGFGLPVLEAMACGAPVITSDRTSLPEVAGRADALFDPYSVDSISTALARVLEDRDFADELRRHGLAHARQFTWDRTAVAALAAFEAAVAERASDARPTPRRPTLAYVSPLPPERSGISDYSEELLPALVQHYDIVAITPERRDDLATAEGRIPVRGVEWFEANATSFDRVVYHFGNSEFHAHMFDLLPRHTGAVVLHDFYLSGIVSYLDHTGRRQGLWADWLYRSHGYPALAYMEATRGSAAAIWKFPACLPVLQDALGVIVHSRYARGLAAQWYGPEFADRIECIEQLHAPVPGLDAEERRALRSRLGIPEDALLACSFGMLGENKNNAALLDAWQASGLAERPDAYLLFVGEVPESEYGRNLRDRVRQAGPRVRITGFVDAGAYRDHLQAADFAVQLRTLSRGETSRAALDCIAAGLPLIVNANGSMAELPDDVAIRIADAFGVDELADALRRMADGSLRAEMSMRQRVHAESVLAPDKVAREFRDALERIHAWPPARSMAALADDLARSGDHGGDAVRQARLADSVAFNTPFAEAPAQLFVDVSELARTDAKSGIQRVVHGVLSELLAREIPGFRVEPVYTPGDGHYYYARSFVSRYMSLGTVLPDEPVDFRRGDAFLVLDMAPTHFVAAEAFVRRMRQKGVRVCVVVYDMLPLQRPDCFPPEADGIFRPWTSAVGRCATVLACISTTVAGDARDAMDVLGLERADPLPACTFPLGMSLTGAAVQPGAAAEALLPLGDTPVLLMVGTLEPRKGHAQALDAMEQLWACGHDVQLAIVGKRGWMVDGLVERIESHPELGRRLHWYRAASDEVLEALYARASLLLCASEAEGYGLPLLEGAAHGLPVVARDIPVFREVARDRPEWFAGVDGASMAAAIERALKRASAGTGALQRESVAGWKESVDALLDIVFGNAVPAAVWQPASRHVWWATDPRIEAPVGLVAHGVVRSRGTPGTFFRIPGITLAPGRYSLSLDADVQGIDDDARAEVVGNGGRAILSACGLGKLLAGARLSFVVSRDCGPVEVRVAIGRHGTGEVRKAVLEEIPDGMRGRAPVEADEPGSAHKNLDPLKESSLQ